MYKFEFITDWDKIWSDDFQKEWLRWFENSEEPNLFFHPEFVKVWVETYNPIRDIKPLFCIAKDKQNNTIFLPLVLWSKDWKSAFEKVIVPVGYSDYDYNFPLISLNNNINWDNYWKELFIELNNTFKNSFDSIDLVGIKESFISNKNNIECEIDDICPLIDINAFDTYDDLMMSLKSKERGDIKRQERRLREIGDFEFKIYTNNDKELALEKLSEILHHHSSKWPNAYKAPNYHKNLIEKILPTGFMHMSEILIDKKSISWIISFIYNGIYYFYMPTFVEEFRKFSPGKVHMFLCIKDCFEKEFKFFDMLKGAEDYKNKLPTIDTNVYKIKIKNDKLSTKIKKVALNVKSKIK